MKDEKKLMEAYKLTIEARNFHYSNFNKWMTFFYVAVGAIFIAFYTIHDNESDQNASLKKSLLPSLGFIISILGYLSCKGYYYWINNWRNQIKRFEDALFENDNTYKVYSVFSRGVQEKENSIIRPFQSANISTSRIGLLFFLIIDISWGYILIKSVLPINCCIGCSISCVLLSMFLTLICSVLGGLFLKSKITKETHSLTEP